MENNISALVTSQIPEYLRGSSPIFAKFLETYYVYAGARDKSIGVIQNRYLEVDIDESQESNIAEFYSIYGEYLPSELALDRRNFIKLLNSIYSAKGTEKALQLVFRALFNEAITVSYPSEQILKVSDGKWESEKYITLINQFGNDPTGNVTLSFSNAFGDYSIETTRIENIDVDTTRFYFNSTTKIEIEDNQLAFVYDNETMVYAGGLIPSPSKLIITSPGKSWQVGQVIIIPGSIKNSIAKITSIDANGGIQNVDVLEYGYVHEPNQTVVISPFKNKPTGSIFDVNSVLVSINPNVYHHTININDFTDGLTEDIVGVSDAISTNLYFLESYATGGYNGQVVIAQSFTQTATVMTSQDTGLTIADWLESRATIRYDYSNVVSAKGYFRDDGGQISNQSIRTQDNYFYQVFSYLIETSRDIREYKNILNITHPAGTKRFSNLAKTINHAFDFGSDRTLSIDTMYLLDIANTQDSLESMYFSKYVFDEAVSTDSINSKYFGKILFDSVDVVDSINSKKFDKYVNDLTTNLDTSYIDFEKLLLDYTLNTDVISNSLSKIVISDVTISGDITNRSVDKYIIDEAMASSMDVVEEIAGLYDEETYFSEKYVRTEYKLSIG